jgi:CubicO group peptidase (beta-lactamase class C family)
VTEEIPMTRREFGFAMMAAGARESAVRELTTWLQEQIDAKVIPGVKVMSVWKGKPFVEIFLGTYCDQYRRDNRADAKSIHPFASFSKMVTATAVVMAWQDGLIDLDAPVAKYVPEFAAHGKDKVTVRMCLNHSAGIPTAIPDKVMDTAEHWDETLALVCAKQPEWEPGSRTQYHGSTGPMVAAACVRRQSGNKSWHAICRERIFQPLGLASFTFELPPPEPSVVLYGPPKDPSAGAAQYRNLVNNPGGGMMGTAGDALKFLRFHARGGVWNGKRLLGERYWQEMHTNQFTGKPATTKDKPGYEPWGLGMMLRPGQGLGNTGWLGSANPQARRIFSHAGISTVLGVGDPDAELEIMILTTDVPSTTAKAADIRRNSIDGVYKAMA